MKIFDLIFHLLSTTDGDQIVYLNCRERYKDMIDHRCYTDNLCSFEIKARKKFRPKRDLNP